MLFFWLILAAVDNSMKHPVSERSVDNGRHTVEAMAAPCYYDEWMEAKTSKTQLRSSEIAKKTPVTFSDVRCSMVRSLHCLRNKQSARPKSHKDADAAHQSDEI